MASLFQQSTEEGKRDIEIFNLIISNSFGQFSRRVKTDIVMVDNECDPNNPDYSIKEILRIKPDVDKDFNIIIKISYLILRGDEPDVEFNSLYRFKMNGDFIKSSLVFKDPSELLVLDYLCASNTSADKLKSFFTEVLKFIDERLPME